MKVLHKRLSITCCPWLKSLHLCSRQGRKNGWKVEGDQGLGPNTGAFAPRARRTGCWVREGVAPPAVKVRGYYPRKICENSDAKSWFWWLLAVKFLAFSKLWPRSWGDQYIVGPQPKSWGPVSPGPYGCCAYDSRCLFSICLNLIVLFCGTFCAAVFVVFNFLFYFDYCLGCTVIRNKLCYV